MDVVASTRRIRALFAGAGTTGQIGVIAFAIEFAIFGVAAIAIGLYTFRRAGEFSETNKAVTTRFFSGRVGQAAANAFGASAYRVAGGFVIVQ